MIYWAFSRFTNSSPLITAQGIERFFSNLEIEEYQRFTIPKRKSEWLASRLLVKRLVQKVIPSDSPLRIKLITVQKENTGVPFVVVEGFGRVGWLSISHSHHGVLAAFTQEDEVRFGVDLEFIEPRPLDLFADYFTPSEVAWISASANDKKDLHANLVWSAKEAFLKAIEKGLQMDTRKINIHPSGTKLLSKGWNAIEFSVDEIISQKWKLLFSHDQDFVKTICLVENKISKLMEVEVMASIDD